VDTVAALNDFGMNDFEKIILRYDRKFWDDNVYAFRRQGSAGNWWHSWYDLTDLHGSFALLTFAAGPCAIATRHMTDEEVTGLVTDALREMYGDLVPDPVYLHRTAWKDDPYAFGSYSYLRVGADLSAFERLAAPIDGVLQITGEATWRDDSATVAAAMFSGHRAVENILGTSVPISGAWQ
jgi:monoamine oxidase